MSKQLIIVLILIAVLIAGGTFWLLTPKSSTPKEVATTPSGTTGFPSGGDSTRVKDDTTTTKPEGSDTKTGNGFLSEQNKKKEIFQELVKDSVAGVIAIERKRENGSNSTFVRYVERATGHVKELIPGQSDATRIANTTVPKSAQAIFGMGGNALVLRVLTDPFNEISTILASIVTATSTNGGTGKLDGVTLPEKVSSLAISPDGKRVFTLVPDGEGSRGIVQDISGKNRREIMRSPLAEWEARWGSTGTITLTTRAGNNTTGYVYSLDVENGKLSRVFAGTAGLTTLVSSISTAILASEGGKAGLSTYVYDTKSSEKKAFPLITLSEKCVWSKKTATVLYCAVPESNVPFTSLPDAWYKGDLSFSDSFWEIDTATMKTTSLGSPEVSVDAINLSLSPSENLLLFTNKSNGHLWSLGLSE